MQSFYSRLLAILFILFIAITGFLLWLSHASSQALQDEVTQELHLDLAKQILKDTPLWPNSEMDLKAIKDAFHMMMVLGPATELYILDPQGKLITYAAEEEKIKLRQINIAPIQQVIDSKLLELPVYGQDPRNSDKLKVFSAAPIYNQDKSQLRGYLYIILGGEKQENITNNLATHRITYLASSAMALGLGAVFLMAGLLFYLLTKPLRVLDQQISNYQKQPLNPPQLTLESGSREFLHLQQTFNQMSGQISQQLESLQKNDSMRKNLLAQLSHDLKTPLAAVRAYLETFSLSSQQLDQQQQQDFINKALQQCDVLNQRIFNILELAKLEAEQVKADKEPFCLAELCQDMILQLQPIADKKQVKIDLFLDKNCSEVDADIAQISRVLSNLLENAIEYSPSNSHIKVSLNVHNKQLITSIRDQGPGLRLGHSDENPYYSISSQQGENSHFGLGLNICQALLGLHQSQLNIHQPQANASGCEIDFALALAKRCDDAN